MPRNHFSGICCVCSTRTFLCRNWASAHCGADAHKVPCISFFVRRKKCGHGRVYSCTCPTKISAVTSGTGDGPVARSSPFTVTPKRGRPTDAIERIRFEAGRATLLQSVRKLFSINDFSKHIRQQADALSGSVCAVDVSH